jgi:hypothetical protein
LIEAAEIFIFQKTSWNILLPELKAFMLTDNSNWAICSRQIFSYHSKRIDKDCFVTDNKLLKVCSVWMLAYADESVHVFDVKVMLPSCQEEIVLRVICIKLDQVKAENSLFFIWNHVKALFLRIVYNASDITYSKQDIKINFGTFFLINPHSIWWGCYHESVLIIIYFKMRWW